MAITYTHTFNGKTTIVGQDFDDNFTDIANKFNGGISNADITASAAIDSTKLAENKFVSYVTIKTTYGDTGAAMPAAGTVWGVTPFPEDNGVTWTVDRVSWYCSNTGAGTGKIDVVLGDYDATPAWATDTIIVNGETLDNSAGADDINTGSATVSGTSFTTDSSGTQCLAILVDTQDANTMDVATDYLTVTIKLTRQITA